MNRNPRTTAHRKTQSSFNPSQPHSSLDHRERTSTEVTAAPRRTPSPDSSRYCHEAIVQKARLGSTLPVTPLIIFYMLSACGNRDLFVVVCFRERLRAKEEDIYHVLLEEGGVERMRE